MYRILVKRCSWPSDNKSLEVFGNGPRERHQLLTA